MPSDAKTILKQKSPRYLRVGITGGIGSGKSTVCNLFARLGRAVLSADAIARSLTDGNDDIKASIRKAFGTGVFLPNGAVDRKALAAHVFMNRTRLQTLNAIIHPHVFRAIEQALSQLPTTQRQPYVVIEAALIFESGMDKQLDYVVVVSADEGKRIDRVMKRDGVTREEVLARMQSQMNVEQALRRADFVLTNNGTEPDLERSVAFVDSLLKRL